MMERLAIRDLIRDLICKLYADGVLISLKDGKIRIKSTCAEGIAPEALALVKQHKHDFVRYLTTPPREKAPCAACGRVEAWELDWMGLWVCVCYKRPDLRRAAKKGHSTEEEKNDGETLRDFWVQ